MGRVSIISGYIVELEDNHASNWTALQKYNFDPFYPFTNIFWSAPSAVGGERAISFTGAYRQIEDDWIEWMWKFGQLLSRLAARLAYVHLEGVNGGFHWHLRPQNRTAGIVNLESGGAQWEIYAWDRDDFTLSPPWCDGEWAKYNPDKIVPRATERFEIRSA